VKAGEEEVDQGEEEPFATLVVEAVTASGHVRCVRKEGETGDPAPKEGDLVRLVPVCPAEEREEVVCVRPLTFKKSEEDGTQEIFTTLVQEKLLAADWKIGKGAVTNPPGASKYNTADAVDGRVVCDDLGVDGVLSGRCIVAGKELFVFANVVLHPQSDVYGEDEEPAKSILREDITITLEEEGKVTPKAAAEVAAEIMKRFGANKGS
jgi:hypothetical protein